MKFYKDTILKSVYTLIVFMTTIASTGCSSFDDEMFERCFDDVPEINVKCGETFNVLSYMCGEDTMIIPVSATDFTYKSKNPRVARQVEDNTFIAVDAGTTEIQIRTGAGHLMKSITVTVDMHATITINQNEVLKRKEISALVSDKNIENLSVTDLSILRYYADFGGWLASKPGRVVMHNSDVWIEVNVLEHPLKNLYNVEFKYLDRYIHGANIVNLMKNYKCTYEGLRTYNGVEYHIKEYKPVDNAASMTFYFSTRKYYFGEDYDFYFAIIDTGWESSEVLKWLILCGKYNIANVSGGGTSIIGGKISGFETPGGGWCFNLTPVDGSWSKLKVSGSWR